jgi:hypothetical protein
MGAFFFLEQSSLNGPLLLAFRSDKRVLLLGIPLYSPSRVIKYDGRDVDIVFE